jgi:NTP pyrophosphatase (non-canonical NTP hydrolase)
MNLNPQAIIAAGKDLTFFCHGQARDHGWWTELGTGQDLTSKGYPKMQPTVNVGEKLMLITTEVAEAMEGHRKLLMDDHLPERTMLEVELADVVIRVFDLAGGLDLDVAGAIAEKLAYNAQRADHKIENRRAVGGKKV